MATGKHWDREKLGFLQGQPPIVQADPMSGSNTFDEGVGSHKNTKIGSHKDWIECILYTDLMGMGGVLFFGGISKNCPFEKGNGDTLDNSEKNHSQAFAIGHDAEQMFQTYLAPYMLANLTVIYHGTIH